VPRWNGDWVGPMIERVRGGHASGRTSAPSRRSASARDIQLEERHTENRLFAFQPESAAEARFTIAAIAA